MKNRTSWSLTLFDALASVQLAVVTMVVLAVVCAVATFYESARGTGMAQRVFYRSPWFTLLLVVLGINVLFSMLKRYPWNRHQAGFVLAHVGILLILEGSLASLHFGTDGSLAVPEGGSSREYRVDGLALGVTVAEHAVQTEVPVDFDSSPPGPGSERSFGVGSGISVVAEDFAPHVQVTSGLEETPDGPPALHFKLEGGGFGEQHGWLVADADGYSFGPLALSFHRAATEADARAVFAAVPDDQSRGLFVQLPGGEVRYELTSRKASPSRGVMTVETPIETPWMGMTLTVERAVAHVGMANRVAPAPSPANENERQPAVKVRLDGPWGRTAAAWIPWGDGREVPIPGGKALVSFRDRQAVLPFRVELLDFNSDKYPGSAMAAT
ncbi:MAG TPA: hypothetical protein VFM29_07560, partial [Vicinamibacteria bacterium]|nr:hypothetical protein [Vicinamibacteria bacterium]